MAWQNEICLIVRHLISDLGSSDEMYSDSRIEEVILVAAQLLLGEVDFDNTYVIDADSLVISPDPTTAGSKDDGFINLVSLKGATIILRGEMKASGAQSFVIKDGPSTIDVKGVYQAKKEILKDMEEVLGRAIVQFKIGDSRAGQAILTPFCTEMVGSRGRIF